MTIIFTIKKLELIKNSLASIIEFRLYVYNDVNDCRYFLYFKKP